MDEILSDLIRFIILQIVIFLIPLPWHYIILPACFFIFYFSHIPDIPDNIYPKYPMIEHNKKLAIIIPIYLPNEIKILSDTINHFRNLPYQGKKEIIFTCNGNAEFIFPTDVTVLHNKDSHSKADNLNAAVDYLRKNPPDYVGIYDADNKPHPDCLEHAVSYLEATKNSIVTGYIYNNELLSTIYLSLMFRVYILADKYPIVSGFNSFFQWDILDKHAINNERVAEDICYSMKLNSMNIPIIHNYHIKCPDPAPPNFKEFYKQRKRWILGHPSAVWHWKYQLPRDMTVSHLGYILIGTTYVILSPVCIFTCSWIFLVPLLFMLIVQYRIEFIYGKKQLLQPFLSFLYSVLVFLLPLLNIEKVINGNISWVPTKRE
jgi:cellulose synthase/poly-beta-1,6-N-acetylglucosamine synthase-like glycosyltransferase